MIYLELQSGVLDFGKYSILESTRFWKVLDFGKEMQVLKELFGRNTLVNILFGCCVMDGKNLVVILQNS